MSTSYEPTAIFDFITPYRAEIRERTYNSVTEHGVTFKFFPEIEVTFWGDGLKGTFRQALELLENYDLAHADESFDPSTFTPENKIPFVPGILGKGEEKPMKPRDVVCPTCNAAVGAKCTEKKLDGHSFIESYHTTRYKESEHV